MAAVNHPAWRDREEMLRVEAVMRSRLKATAQSARGALPGNNYNARNRVGSDVELCIRQLVDYRHADALPQWRYRCRSRKHRRRRPVPVVLCVNPSLIQHRRRKPNALSRGVRAH